MQLLTANSYSLTRSIRKLSAALCVPFHCADILASGAPFLDQPAGKTFTDKLWAETVADIARFDENLKVYA